MSNIYAPEVNGTWLGYIEQLDREPHDYDLSAGGMGIWLRYLGPASLEGSISGQHERQD